MQHEVEVDFDSFVNQFDWRPWRPDGALRLYPLRDEHDLAILKMKNSVSKIQFSGIRVSEDHVNLIALILHNLGNS